jgi:hypothetical protein
MPIVVKGVGFDAGMRFAEEQCGARAVADALAELGRRRGIVYPEQRVASALLALPAAAAAWQEVYLLAGGEQREPARSFFQRMGRFIAVHNLGGVYRGLLQFFGSPALLARRTSTMWQTYFPGVAVELDNARLKEGEHAHRVRGFEGVPFIGAMGEGWMFYAFELVGARELSVAEAATARGELVSAGPLEYTVRWCP